MIRKSMFLLLSILLLAAVGCATVPSGPSVMVLPPPDKPFEVFQSEDALCRQWAAQQIGMSPQDVRNENVAAGAVAGTILGAGLGAAIGSASGDVGSGAAIGAASGLVVGSAAGAGNAQYYGAEAQRRYDIAYMQCMYSKGNQIPGTTRTRSGYRMPPPPPGSGSAPPRYYQPPQGTRPPDQ